MTTVCLNMIVKNEGKIIKRLLDSCYKLLDYWVIVDTGSTDNTKEIIRKYFEEKKIPGELHEKEFVNFGFNRTHALKLAKNKADYLFFMDADHVIDYDETFFKEQLKSYDEINIQLKTGILKYYLIRFLKADMNISSVGVTHEYYEYDKKNPKIARFKNIWINDHGDGGCRHVKFERDIKLLTYSINKNPTNPRNIFYLAESYRNSKQFEKAIEFYKKRADLDYFHEEKWFSIYMIGKCYSYLDLEKEMVMWCLKAYQEKPTRSEPLYLLAEYYQKKGKYAISDIFCEIGSKIKYPDNDLLFVEEDIYRYKFLYLKGIIYYYINKDASKELNLGIIQNNIPNEYYFNMLDNIKYYRKSLVKELSLTVERTNISFNKVCQSILNYNNKFYIINNLNPMKILDMNIYNGQLKIYKKYTNYCLHPFKICTNFINIDNNYVVCIYHNYEKKRLHKFIVLDENLSIKCITPSFYFIEFCNENVFELQYNHNSIQIFLCKDEDISFKINITKKIFNKYLFQYILG